MFQVRDLQVELYVVYSRVNTNENNNLRPRR